MQKAIRNKLILAAAAAGFIVLFFALDLNQYLTLAELKARQAQLQQLSRQHPVLVLGGFFMGYVLVVALNLPGAAVMTLAAGAFFGFWTGLVLVSFASSLGATLACLLARYLLRDYVQTKFGERLKKVNDGVNREGAFYLFTMRLIPAIPFFAINLAMGLTPIKLWTFYWVSQVGMLAGTAVFVNAGVQLGQIESLGDILSWQLLLSFALLGAFPLAVKKGMVLYRKKTGKAVEPVK